MFDLPNAEQLVKLPLRAIAAYAARAARRTQAVLCNVVDNDLIEEALVAAELAASTELPDALAAASAAMDAASRLTVVATSLEQKNRMAVMAIESADITAYTVLLSTVLDKSKVARWAAQAAEYAAERSVLAVEEPTAAAIAKASRREYEVLLKAFGEHDSVVVGELIDVSDESVLFKNLVQR